MGKYAVIQQINGAYAVKFEGADLDSIKYNYFNWLALLYNDTGAAHGVVKLVDENLDVVDGCVEFINKDAKE